MKNPRRIRFKTTQQLLNLPGAVKSIYDSVRDGIQDIPPTFNWNGLHPLRVEDVDIWEVILENSRLGIGIYAAWCPYDELYIVTQHQKITHEFYGFKANEELEKFLIKNNINYPKSHEPTGYKNIPVEKIYIPL